MRENHPVLDDRHGLVPDAKGMDPVIDPVIVMSGQERALEVGKKDPLPPEFDQ